jgi:hypothetical protein
MPICESDSTSVDRQQTAKCWPHSYAYCSETFWRRFILPPTLLLVVYIPVEFEVE